MDKNNSIIHLEAYGLDVDLKTYSVEFDKQVEEYIGGLDSDGHERKDNFGLAEYHVSYFYDEEEKAIIRTSVDEWESCNLRPVSYEKAVAEIAENAQTAQIYERDNIQYDDYGSPIGTPLLEEKGVNTMAEKTYKWDNFGDDNFAAEGGVMTRPMNDRPNDYEFFQLQIDDEGNRYAFHGVVSDLKDYADNAVLEQGAIDLNYADAADFIENSPERAVVELVENYGYGAMEFSATNKDGQGAYSTDKNDFKLSEQELAEFMTKLDIPVEFIPEFEYQLESKYGKNGIEDTFKTNDWSEVEAWSHEKLMDGLSVEINDVKYGQSASLDPDRYQHTHDARGGEFPVDERYMSVDYGDDKEIE